MLSTNLSGGPQLICRHFSPDLQRSAALALVGLWRSLGHGHGPLRLAGAHRGDVQQEVEVVAPVVKDHWDGLGRLAAVLQEWHSAPRCCLCRGSVSLSLSSSGGT